MLVLLVILFTVKLYAQINIFNIAICCLTNIQKPWVDTGSSQHQDFKHTNLGVLKQI